VDAFVRALCEGCGVDVHVMNYHEHAVGSGEDATAVAYVQIRIGRDQTLYGAGMHGNIVTATLRAVLSAVNRAAGKGLITVREPAQRIAAA
jgi:2-isopropylmalate synthase